MTSDMLSQDEIDALLKQGGDDQADEELSVVNYITALEQDALGEIGNITFGTASTALSTLLSQKVDITTPKLTIVKKESLADEFPMPHVAVHVNYTDGFEGVNLLVMKTDDAAIIADLMLGGDGTSPNHDMSSMHISAVQEAMNQMMGTAATSMSTIFNKKIDISPPGVDMFDPSVDEQQVSMVQEDILIKVSFRIKVGELIDSNIMQLIPVSFAKEMIDLLMNPEAQEFSEEIQEEIAPEPTSSSYQPAAEVQVPHQEINYSSQPSVPAQSQNVTSRAANVQPVQFASFEQNSAAHGDIHNLNLLMDIPLQVTVELGRTKKLIKEILELSPGSIIELDKLAGEPVDILVNNKLIAKGEVVVIEENFGVRVTDILSQIDRIQKLQ
ncbi:flagellar motor switch phosphatase FliY [Bacillus horti]|uniref:Flagellar motor switch protein FliN/FliY n=1 Tax=Caldalkalibacillus horti TaxID=77523 RepID=A0ABT9VUM0_9BACI|nr:flagellar motor switch phosphatase FliY [Bacillus horti]MDQ0164673.1 flagellar motor switch protein FliN/FliY [Bacillus horti]